MTKNIKLRPRKKYWGWCYRKRMRLRMTGKEWHEYAKWDTFKTEHGGDSAWGNKCEIWFDKADDMTEVEEPDYNDITESTDSTT